MIETRRLKNVVIFCPNNSKFCAVKKNIKNGVRKIWLHKTLIGCLRKNFIRGNLIFLSHFLLFDCALSKLHQPIQTIGSLDMIRIRKQSRHDFSGKHLCDGYCMDI